MGDDAAFAAVVADSLRFTWVEGGVPEVPAGYSTGWRIMPTAVVAAVRRGTARLHVADQRPREIVAGTAICIPPGTLHRVDHARAGASTFTHCTYRVFATVDVLALVRPPQVITGGPAEAIIASLVDLAGLAGRSALADICARQALGLTLLRTLLDAAPANVRAIETMRAAQRLAPVLAVIERDLAAVDLPALARRARLSPSRLHAVFHEAFACSPMRWVRRRRIERARETLASTALPVGEVAELCGFPDQFHFSRAFKREHGCSPSAYRLSLQDAIL